MRFEYCPECGKKTVLREIGDEGLTPFCEGCNRPLFDMFSTCVLNVVVNEENEVLLIRQSYGDTSRFVGVAGYMKVDETPEQAAEREVLEETGLSAESVRYIDSVFYEERDQLMLGMVAKVKKKECHISDELLEAKWFTFDEAEKTVREGSIIQRFIQTAKENVLSTMDYITAVEFFEVCVESRDKDFLLRVTRKRDGADMCPAMEQCGFSDWMYWMEVHSVPCEEGFLLEKCVSEEKLLVEVRHFLYRYRKVLI